MIRALFLSILLLSACSSIPKKWEAMNGSKTDGTITMSYVYRPILDTQPKDDSQAENIASIKCKAWGYSNAVVFGRESKECYTRTSDGDCTSVLVKKIYQCTVK